MAMCEKINMYSEEAVVDSHAMQESAALQSLQQTTHTTPSRQPANSNVLARSPQTPGWQYDDADAGSVLTLFDNAVVLSSSFSQAANQ
ncbi:hypothetical protein E4U37_005484 [Claviceps purpurea]|nr:hypothetical protein E4U37_005484 [Claviceps purpurea]